MFILIHNNGFIPFKTLGALTDWLNGINIKTLKEAESLGYTITQSNSFRFAEC